MHALRTQKIAFTLNLCSFTWILSCFAIWYLLTWNMGGSDRSCCVPRCGKTRKDDTVLHSFPNPDIEMEQYIAWTQAVGIDSSCVDPQFVLKNRKVCHAHFEEKFLTWTRRLGPGAIPTLFVPGLVPAHDGCDSPREFIGHNIDGEVKELIKYEHSYATPRSSNGELQKEDTIVDETSLNTYENGVDTTQIVLTKLIESYNIEETCYSDAEQLLSHLDIAEVTEIASIAENKENIALQNQNEIRKTSQKSENISNHNLSSCDDLLSDTEECQNTKKIVNTATTKYPENIKTGQMHHVLANANKVNKSCAGFRRNRKHLYYPIQPKSGRSAIISKQEITKISTLRENCSIKAYICFDRYYVSKESQANLNQIKPLFVSGGFEPNDGEPVEDPLAIHSPDLGIKNSMCSVENIMNVVEDHNVSNIEVEENKSSIEDNMSDIEDSMSNIEDNMSTVEDNLSDVEDNMSYVEDNMSNVDDNMNTVEDSISTEKGNMSFKKDSRHLVDSFVDRDYDDLDLRLEIAYALKFKYQEGKTSKEAVEEIIEKYGRGKLSLEEAKCWYNEFNLGNNIMRIIFSGGPIFR